MPSTKLYSVTQARNIGGITPHILKLGIRPTETVKFTPQLRFSHGGSSDTLWVGCWVALRPSLDALNYRKICLPAGIRALDSSANRTVV